MTPQAKKAAEDICHACGLPWSNIDRIANDIDRAFADVLRERDELREALATWIFRWDDGGFYDQGHGELIELCRALLSK